MRKGIILLVGALSFGLFAHGMDCEGKKKCTKKVCKTSKGEKSELEKVKKAKKSIKSEKAFVVPRTMDRNRTKACCSKRTSKA